VIYVKHSGLFVWDEDIDRFTKVDCGNLDASVYEADQIRATPDGRHVAVGFPKANKVLFFAISQEETNLVLLPT